MTQVQTESLNSSSTATLETLKSFQESCTEAARHATDGIVAVFTIGLEGIKSLNATLGYAFTDEVMELCCARLLSALRDNDRLLHHQRDEFSILVRSLPDGNAARAVAVRLKDLLQRPFLVRGHMANLEASVGIALGSVHNIGEVHDIGTEDLIQRSSIALRSAMTSDPGSIRYFENAMERGIFLRHSLSVELRKALMLKQLELHYQPQAHTKTLQLIGFEALLRWKHPTLGWISPADFIPLAEELGLIDMIGDWVLRAACRQAIQLPSSIVMAVNVSPIQLRNASFVQAVEGALSKAKLPGNRLELEITEGVLLRDSEVVLSALRALQEMGVRLAMDDFGTGYSSLSQVAKLPFNTIKIDRSLMGGSTKKRAIVRSIATLGIGLGITILAEGVETEEELAYVRADGCTFLQGYLFGRPVPAASLPDLLKKLYQPV